VDASFPIISTSIVANLSKDTIDRAKGESVTVTGQINPGIANVPITVTFVKPDGSSVDRVVTASEEGGFIVSRTLDTVGNWTVTAWFSGAEYPSHTYTSAYSADLPLKVVDLQKPPSEEGIPREYVYAGVAILVMVIIVIAGYAYIRRGKK
jgi:hypothetical protein